MGNIDEEMLHPKNFGGKIPYPKSLSPSAAMAFMKCPQSYLIQYLYGIKQPTNLAMTKGSLCHSALEQLYDFDPPQRDLNFLQDIFRRIWAEKKSSYKVLFSTGGVWDSNKEIEWGKNALDLLSSYYNMEDPRKVPKPNPIQREKWISYAMSVDPLQEIAESQEEKNNN